jgi:ABC-2 type transport system ATP-binding protein
MTVIEVRSLAKRFGPAAAVNGLSFAVGAGTVAGFLGPNGAGKTTTLRVLLSLVRPTSGQATIWGKPYRELGNRRRRVGAVLEASGFHPGRTVADHLRVRCAAAGAASSRIRAVLAETGMGELAGRRTGNLSLGERQRLGLAGALLGDPEVLILDKPANGLDPAGGVFMGNQLARWFAVAVVGLNAIDMMFFVPAYPFWALVIIAADVVALWGLCAYGSRENLDAV